jgi:hypothetical protein
MQRTACNTHARTHEHPRGCGTLACTHARTLYRALTHLAEPLCCERVVCLAPDAHPTEGGRRATCSTRYATRNIQHAAHPMQDARCSGALRCNMQRHAACLVARCAHDAAVAAPARTRQRCTAALVAPGEIKHRLRHAGGSGALIALEAARDVDGDPDALRRAATR